MGLEVYRDQHSSTTSGGIFFVSTTALTSVTEFPQLQDGDEFLDKLHVRASSA